MRTPFDDDFIDLFKPDLANDKVTTMTKMQETIVKKGEAAGKEQCRAMSVTLRGTTTRRILLAVTTATLVFRQAAGHMTEIIDPGTNGRLMDLAWLNDVKGYIKERSPEYFYTHIPHDHDDTFFFLQQTA